MDRVRLRQFNQVDSMLNVIVKQFHDIKSVCGEVEDFYVCELNEEEIKSLNNIARKIMGIQVLAKNIDEMI